MPRRVVRSGNSVFNSGLGKRCAVTGATHHFSSCMSVSAPCFRAVTFVCSMNNTIDCVPFQFAIAIICIYILTVLFSSIIRVLSKWILFECCSGICRQALRNCEEIRD